MVFFSGFTELFGVEVLTILGSRVTTGAGLLLNSRTRAHVIMLSKYLYTGSLSSSRICNDFKFKLCCVLLCTGQTVIYLFMSVLTHKIWSDCHTVQKQSQYQPKKMGCCCKKVFRHSALITETLVHNYAVLTSI